MKKVKRYFFAKKRRLILAVLLLSFIVFSSFGMANPTGSFLQQLGETVKGLFFRVISLENKTQELQNRTSCIGVVEVCNGLDENDCDRLTDDDLFQTCGSDIGECRKGIQFCSQGSFGPCVGAIDPKSEVCDGKDNDCDGTTDEDGVCAVCGNGIVESGEQCDDGNNVNGDGCSSTCQIEACPPGQVRCVQQCVNILTDPLNCGVCGNVCPQGQSCANGLCVAPDLDGDGFPSPQDCNDTNPAINPAAPEVCDGLDNNCDGQIDEGLGSTTCGIGACQNTVQNCVGGVSQVCTPGSPTVEVCDGIDNDCDGLVDEGADASCVFSNAIGACQGGACALASCNQGFGNCDAVSSNGCETNIFNDPNNCGGCSLVCPQGQTCSNGVCKKVTGAACASSTECASGFCVDGVCSNTACSGLCQRADLQGSVGTCTFIPKGQDPDNECPSTLTCDGVGGCT